MRIFIPLRLPPVPSQIHVPPDKSHYMISVMRVKKGDMFEVIDGAGNAYKARVAEVAGRQLRADLLERLSTAIQPSVRLILCQSLLKGRKNDLVVQKTTELGVSGICPVVAGRSIPRDTSRIARWRKIAEEAAEQSGRSDVPIIRDAVSYMSLFDPEGILMHGKGLILSTREGVSFREGLRQALGGDSHASAEGAGASSDITRTVFLVVGPEGGFTVEEEETGLRHGLTAVSMGGLILRAETAAIAAVAILHYLMGEELSAQERSAGI